jgi:hypothetical protein
MIDINHISDNDIKQLKRIILSDTTNFTKYSVLIPHLKDDYLKFMHDLIHIRITKTELKKLYKSKKVKPDISHALLIVHNHRDVFGIANVRTIVNFYADNGIYLYDRIISHSISNITSYGKRRRIYGFLTAMNDIIKDNKPKHIKEQNYRYIVDRLSKGDKNDKDNEVIKQIYNIEYSDAESEDISEFSDTDYNSESESDIDSPKIKKVVKFKKN